MTIRIYSQNEMTSYQKTILLKLNNDTVLNELKVLFINNPSLINFTNLFNYINKQIKCSMKKVKACSGLIFYLNFNFTNNLGFVFYNNTITIQKCKKINTYSSNVVDIINMLYNNYTAGNKFNNPIQNSLAQQAISSAIPEQFYQENNNGTEYISMYTPGTAGASNIIYFSIYHKNDNTPAILDTDYFILSTNTKEYDVCVLIVNFNAYTIIFGQNTTVYYEICGGGGGGGYGCTSLDLGGGCGGGGGGGGGAVSSGSFVIAPSINLDITIGNGGKGGTFNYKSTNGDPTTITSTGITNVVTNIGSYTFTDNTTTITANGGGRAGNGDAGSGGAAGIGGMSSNNGATGTCAYGKVIKNGGSGYSSIMSNPMINCVSGGGSGGGATIYDAIVGGNGGNTGGGGGGGGGITQGLYSPTTAMGGSGVSCGYSPYSGGNGGASVYTGTNNDQKCKGGNGGGGSFGGGGGGSGAVSSGMVNSTDRTSNGGNGGFGVAIIYLHNS